MTTAQASTTLGNTLKSLKQLIAVSVDRQLAELLSKADAYDRLRLKLLALVPAPLGARWVGLAANSENDWTILADSSAAAAQLRFFMPKLKDALARELAGSVQNLRVKVVGPASGPGVRSVASSSVGPSPGVLRDIEFAAAATPYIELRAAFERLAKTLRARGIRA